MFCAKEISNLRFALKEDDVVTYVQTHTRVQERSNDETYAVRHPTPYSGGRALISKDTRELVKKLCMIYQIPLETKL